MRNMFFLVSDIQLQAVQTKKPSFPNRSFVALFPASLCGSVEGICTSNLTGHTGSTPVGGTSGRNESIEIDHRKCNRLIDNTR